MHTPQNRKNIIIISALAIVIALISNACVDYVPSSTNNFSNTGASTLTVISNVPGAAVSLNGTKYGTTDSGGKLTINNLNGGKYNITVTKNDYTTYQSEITISAFRIQSIKAPLVPLTVTSDSQTLGSATGNAIAVTGRATQVVYGNNLIDNPSFETSSGNNGWKRTKDLTWETSTVHSGKHAVEINGATDSYTFQGVTLQPGKTYQLSGYMKAEALSGFGAWITYATTQPSGGPAFITHVIEGTTTGWSYFETNFTLPSDYQDGRLYISYKMDSGTVYIDDLSLNEITQTVQPEQITPVCGNGKVETGEQCDDGNQINTDQCSNTCTLTYCGDRIIQNPNGNTVAEQCDNGSDNGIQCTATAGKSCTYCDSSCKTATYTNTTILPTDNQTGTGTLEVIGPRPVSSGSLSAGTLFASPSGSGTSCSQASPCSITTASSKLSAGAHLFLKGGTYSISGKLSLASGGSGTSSSRIIVESYPNERAVIDGQYSADSRLAIYGNYVTLRNVDVKRMANQGIYIGGNHNIIEGVHSYENHLTGVQIYSPYSDYPYGNHGSYNIIRDSILYDNSDVGLTSGGYADGGNADGISVSSGEGNLIEHVLAYGNSDDGIDSWRSTNTHILYSISHSNGLSSGDGNGIKAGGIAPSSSTLVEHVISYGNRATGFTYNSGKNVTFMYDTSFNNGGSAFEWGSDTTVEHNIESSNGNNNNNGYFAGIVSDNSWQRSGSVSFISLDPASSDFLMPKVGGGFEDIGAYAGLSTTATSNTDYNLGYQDAARTSSYKPLSGASLSGDYYISVYPSDGISSVDFYLDGSHYNTETIIPYDFNGTDNPTNVNAIGAGQHTLKAVITTTGGSTKDLTATFTVQKTTQTQSPSTVTLFTEIENMNQPSSFSFQKVADSTASGGYYMQAPGGTTVSSNSVVELSKSFNAPQSGDYYIWTRAYFEGGWNDSFFTGFDGNMQLATQSTFGQWFWIKSGPYALSVGTHALTMAHREDYSRMDAVVVSENASLADSDLNALLNLSGTGKTGSGTTIPTGAFLAKYYEGTSFNTLFTTKQESSINHNWGYGSPLPGMTNDTFSIIWEGNFNFDTANYTFTANMDDGMRVYVDGKLIIDSWQDQSAYDHNVTVAMSQGYHDIKVEYYENQYHAVAKFYWAKTPSVNSPSPSVGGTQTLSYAVDSSSEIDNPDRGWYTTSTHTTSAYTQKANEGLRLVHYYVRLDNYRDGPLSQSYLNSLKNNLSAARGTGVKVVLRFAYNFGNAPDAPLSVVKEHISQVAPIINQYSDTISAIQAGFIGYWGEWHDSTNDLTSSANEKTIALDELSSFSKNLMIQIRTPGEAQNVLSSPVSAPDAFSGNDASRVGQHNDCFLVDKSAVGTYRYSKSTSLGDADKAYVQQVSTYTAMGGETCNLGGLNSYNDCSYAIQEMARMHWDYLNRDYWSSIIDKWKSQGCYNEITNRLGYRLSLTSSTLPSSASPGSSVNVQFNMQNTGFGKVYNPRPMYLILKGSSGTYKIQIYNDARRYLPLGGETRTISKTITLPSSIPSGTYHMYLWLPSYYSADQNNPLYSIHLANSNVWDSSTGYNNLNANVQVS